MKVGEPELAVSADRQHVTVTVEIEEGAVYRIGKLTFAGDRVTDDKRYLAELRSKPGDVFSRAALLSDDGGLMGAIQGQCYAPPAAEGPAACVNPEYGVPPPCGGSFVERCFDGNRKWTCGGGNIGSATVAPCISCKWQPAGVTCS